MTIESEQIQVVECSLKIREYHEKRFLEAQKTAIEFTKIIISNLIWINSAGIGSLPAILALLDIKATTPVDKFNLTYLPGIVFSIGLISAFICAYLIYLNFSKIADTYNAENQKEINEFYGNLYFIHSNKELKGYYDNLSKNGDNFARTSRKWVVFYFWASRLTGWFSLFCFIGGCYKLIYEIKAIIY